MRAKEKLENAIKEALKETTPAETLVELAKDRHWYVRSDAARNPNTPKKQ